MNDCRNCDNAIFDEVFGERKCKVYEHRIYDIDKYVDCEHHELKKEEKKNDQN